MSPEITVNAELGRQAVWWRRLVAGIVDLALVGALVFVPLIVDFALEISDPAKDPSDVFAIGWMVWSALVCSLYFGLTMLRPIATGQSPGKQLAGIRVVRADAAPLTWTDVVLRETVGKLAFGVCSLGVVSVLDVLWALFTKQRTGLHDLLAKTRVIGV